MYIPLAQSTGRRVPSFSQTKKKGAAIGVLEGAQLMRLPSAWYLAI